MAKKQTKKVAPEEIWYYDEDNKLVRLDSARHEAADPDDDARASTDPAVINALGFDPRKAPATGDKESR